MRPAVVMDTNVAVVANGNAPQASRDCQTICIRELRDIRKRRRIVIDQDGLVLNEYRRQLSPSGQPGPGDAFFKWLWSNQANPRFCARVKITPLNDNNRGFEEFPDDPDLSRFDHSDRKFVALALAFDQDSEILNASDTDWWRFRDTLSRHGLTIRFVCPELMER